MLKNTHTKYFIKIFLIIFLPSICLVGELLVLFSTKEKKYQMEIAAAEAKSIVNVSHETISRTIYSIATDLLTLADSDGVQRMIETGTAPDDLLHDLLHFSLRKKIYDQIRYLDKTGQEIVRVNFNNGEPIIVPESDLQNKAGRYYFTDSIKLSKGEVYISPFDLNIEHGQIEQPLKPMIRVAIPLFDRQGNKRGIFLINYLGADLLNILDQLGSKILGHLMLLDADGYSIKGYNPSDEWGFMYKEGKGRTWSNFFPAIWKQILNDKSGHFRSQDDLFTFATIYPLADAVAFKSSTGSGKPFSVSNASLGNKEYYWKIVHHIHQEDFEFSSHNHAVNLFLLFAALFVIIIAISWFSAIAMSKRQASLRALKESEKKLSILLNATADVAFLTGPDGTFLEVNDAFVINTNRKKEELVGRSILEFFPAVLAEQRISNLQKTIETKKPIHGEDKDSGSYFSNSFYPILDDIGNVQQVAVYVKDITERKQAEEEKAKLESQLHEAHKTDAIATLAGGIAHDFNNILGIIFGNADMALDDIPEENPAIENINDLLEASTRAKKLVKQLLDFTRQSGHDHIPLMPSSLIKESLKFFRSTTPSTINIVQDISTDCGTILSDPSQFQQLLMNLCLNAVQAIDVKGTLEVVGKVVELDADDIAHQPDMRPGSYFKLSVSDTGIGMDAETQKRIFDPFFTTKEVGAGVGMGLSVVMGIVQSHDGMITVDSEPGEGSTFHVFFPQVTLEDVQHTEKIPLLPHGDERILFVDDDKMLLEMGRKMLGRQGYEVTARSSSMNAFETFQSNPDKFDLVVTDQTMPNMTGSELAGELLTIRPDIPVILCTDCSAKITQENALDLGIKEIYEKPFDRSKFVTTIRKVLDENQCNT